MNKTVMDQEGLPGSAPARGSSVPGNCPVAWRDSMRPVRFYVFDARLLLLAIPWLFLPTWWTTAIVAAAMLACRAAEARGYRVPAALRALRAKAAGRRRALHVARLHRFTDFG